MMKIANKIEAGALKNLPVEVIAKVLKISTILDENYGEVRDANIYGGYVLVVENKEDIKKLNDEIAIDVADVIPEYVDLIECSDGGKYTSSLILCNNDFAIVLIMELSLTSKELLAYMEE
ncbi:MAG: hypothetical protein ACREVX_01355 [Clostridium sp.]|uniref:hypothetical protein n=1 Tax=Clostridium sp. TaxID=1506 RepID=UPI003D6CD05C